MRHFGKFLCATAILCTIPLFCAFSPTQLTIDFGEEQVVLTERLLQGGWYNYDAKLQLTQGRNLFSRATKMQEDDTFEGTFPDIVHYLNKVAPKYEIATYDGQVNFFPDQNPKFTVTNQQDGKVINREKLYWDILTALKGNKFPVVKVEYLTITPTPPAEIIRNIVKRSEFSTHFQDNPARENNIKLATAKFNGLKVNPGEEVSFNKVVGQRTAAQGYAEAKIIVNGEYVDGIGGGVCQVSTTIFNAVAQAGLQIVESHNHTLRSSYVALGKDAMVSSHSDLRFINNTGATLYFATKVQNNNIFVTIYGRDKGQNISYQLTTETVKETPPTDELDKTLSPEILADYQKHPAKYTKELVTKGQSGYTINTYLETYQGGKRLSKKLLRRATYKAVPNKYTLTLPPAPPPDELADQPVARFISSVFGTPTNA